MGAILFRFPERIGDAGRDFTQGAFLEVTVDKNNKRLAAAARAELRNGAGAHLAGVSTGDQHYRFGWLADAG